MQDYSCDIYSKILRSPWSLTHDASFEVLVVTIATDSLQQLRMKPLEDLEMLQLGRDDVKVFAGPLRRSTA